MVWLLSALLLLAGLFRAVHDTLTHSPQANRLLDWARTKPFKVEGFCWWTFIDSASSWTNKYKNHDAAQGPAFWGSTTIFVGLTDAWHLSNALAWLCFEVAYLLVAWPTYHWWALLPLAVRRLVFEPAYAWFRKQA